MTKPKMQIPNDSGKPTEEIKEQSKTPEQEKVDTVAAPKKKASPSADDILAKIKAESLARVNMDNFMNEEGLGRFDVPKDIIPDGFSVEWKNTHIRGQPVDPSYQLKLQESGWMPAPVEIFKSLVPEGYDGATIERDGQILMIRPIELTVRAREIESRKAAQQMGDKMAQLRATESGTMDRVVNNFSRTFEKIPTE